MVGCPPESVQGRCHWDVIDTRHLGEMLTLEDWGAMCSVGVGLTLEGYGWSRKCPLGVPLVVSVITFTGPGLLGW